MCCHACVENYVRTSTRWKRVSTTFLTKLEPEQFWPSKTSWHFGGSKAFYPLSRTTLRSSNVAVLSSKKKKYRSLRKAMMCISLFRYTESK